MYVDISNIQTNVNGCKLPLLTSVVCFLFLFFFWGGGWAGWAGTGGGGRGKTPHSQIASLWGTSRIKILEGKLQ